MIEHRGGDVGFRSYIELAPDDSFSIVILSNDAGANSSILDIVKAATDLMLEDSVGNKKAAVINNGGVEQISYVKKQSSTEFHLPAKSADCGGLMLIFAGRRCECAEKEG